MNFRKTALEPDCTQMRARKMETLHPGALKEPSGYCLGEGREKGHMYAVKESRL